MKENCVVVNLFNSCLPVNNLHFGIVYLNKAWRIVTFRMINFVKVLRGKWRLRNDLQLFVVDFHVES